MPKISVVMAVYNGAYHLPESIESILRQTLSDFEFLIIDDGSTDSTLEILNKYEKQDKRVRILQNTENIGLTKSLNKGITAAKGTYIARMDADDLCDKDRFHQQALFLDTNPDYGLVGSWYIKIDEQGKELWREKIPTTDQDLQRQLIKRNPLPHASFMMRKRVVQGVGGYDESYKVSQDYEFLFRIIRKCKIGAVPKFLLYSRLCASGITSTRNREQILSGLRAQRNAIKGGQYPKYAYVFLFPRVLTFFMPVFLRQLLKRFT